MGLHSLVAMHAISLYAEQRWNGWEFAMFHDLVFFPRETGLKFLFPSVLLEIAFILFKALCYEVTVCHLQTSSPNSDIQSSASFGVGQPN